ncbi:hypothetical protein [Actinoplanes sp. NPDC026623]|uniref:hypothetical protein n=1 Tax=Actinoplanes sp. NPDC026623 TaxID=3155610 RepID=UPI00340C4572
MTDEEIAGRIARARRREQTPATIGGHAVLLDTIRLPAGVVTTVHRVLDGRITVLRATAGSWPGWSATSCVRRATGPSSPPARTP